MDNLTICGFWVSNLQLERGVQPHVEGFVIGRGNAIVTDGICEETGKFEGLRGWLCNVTMLLL